MGSMGLASNLGKVAVRPCKLPCWEPAENPPPSFLPSHTFPSTRNLVHPRSLSRPGINSIWLFLPFVAFTQRRKVSLCREKTSNSPEAVTWPGANCLKLQTGSASLGKLDLDADTYEVYIYMHMCISSPTVSLHVVNDRINVLAKAYLGVYEGPEPTTIIQVLLSYCFLFPPHILLLPSSQSLKS